MLLNRTFPLAPKCPQENLPFQQEGLAAGKACCSRVDFHKLRSNLIWDLAAVAGYQTFYSLSNAALFGSKEEDHDLQIHWG